MVPLDFLRIPLIALVGWWLYGEPLDIFVFAGAGLIVSGVLWNLRAETQRPVRYDPTAAWNHRRPQPLFRRFCALTSARARRAKSS